MKTGTNTFELKRDNLLPLDHKRIRTLQLTETARTELAQRIDEVLLEEPLSVVREKRLGPSGDPHDYVSVAAYYWPNPTTADGLPWIPRDGEVNPERDNGDCIPWFRTCTVVRLLCLGHVLLEDPRCLPRAEQWLHRWFIDPTSRMNPHMEYSQYVPGLADGHSWGLIDSTLLPGMLDALILVENELDAEVIAQVKAWISTYADWFVNSRLGQEAGASHNNHASWYLAQTVAYLRFVGDDEQARSFLGKKAEQLVESQIEPEGSQPHELVRTLSFMYSSYNLLAHCTSAIYASRLGVEYEGATWQRLTAACDFLETAALEGKSWRWPQIKPLDPTAVIPALAWMSSLRNEPRYLATASEILRQNSIPQSYRWQLLGIEQ